MSFAKGNFRVQVRCGSHDWSITDQDVAADPSMAGQLADGLSIVRSIPEGVPLPWQPDPATASFNVAVASAAAVADVAVGDVVDLRYYSPRDAMFPLERFTGRVTDPVLTPTNFGPPPGSPAAADRHGVVLSVTAVDYLADLARPITLPVGARGQKQAARLAALVSVGMTPYGEAWTWAQPPVGTPLGVFVQGREYGLDAVGSAPLGQVLDELFRSWPTAASADPTLPRTYAPAGLTFPSHRPLFRATVDAVGNLVGWEGYQATSWQDGAKGPLVFGSTPHVTAFTWGVAWSPVWNDSPYAVDGGLVDYGSQWTRSKSARFNQLVARWQEPLAPFAEYVSVEGTGERPVVSYDLATLVQTQHSGLAHVYLPTFENGVPDPATNVVPDWQTGEVTWYLGRDDAGRYLGDDPNGPLGQLVVVVGIVDDVNPTAREWVPGVVQGYQLELTDGQPVLRFRLTPASRRLIGGTDALSWNQVNPVPKWNNLNARDTWDDYRLLRGTP